MSTVVMYSEARGYEGGQLQWSAIHDPDDEARPLALEGEPPAILAGLEAKALNSQAAEQGVDYVFDVPMQLFAHYTGFVYDEDEATDWICLRADGAQPVGRKRLERPGRRGRPTQPEPRKLNRGQIALLFLGGIILLGWFSGVFL
ncbi:MAG: hypothetical protein U1A07_18240 [Phenylobacterium sp.]|jgi:hypothetical protein|nr:hypothetical protein [Phenylobacterium sp.]MDZ4320753.1 hypothetical protein [Phenylobacterium sp.]